jgi:hypothetical protein
MSHGWTRRRLAGARQGRGFCGEKKARWHQLNSQKVVETALWSGPSRATEIKPEFRTLLKKPSPDGTIQKRRVFEIAADFG